jgi:antimicrobial peptide system SdpB family protein
MLTWLGVRTRSWVAKAPPWTNAYGLARTILALGTLGTLLCSPASSLFRPAVGLPNWPICVDATRFGLFCLASRAHLELARWLAIAILALVASGWRPRFTGVLHWWVSCSLATSAILIDGGDQITAVLTLLLIPVTLTDARRWHWSPSIQESRSQRWEDFARLIALTAFMAIRVQVSGVYFHSFVAKLKVPEWTDGTALYYWFTHPVFGATPALSAVIKPLLDNAWTLTFMTWGALGLELVLFSALFMKDRYRVPLLVCGLCFHLGIALIHGLISFAFAMFAALLLYLWPQTKPFALPRAGYSLLPRLLNFTKSWVQNSPPRTGQSSPPHPAQA